MDIQKIVYRDIHTVKNFLEQSDNIDKTDLLQELLVHVKDGVAYKATVSDSIVGVWCSLEFDTHTSLSFFYTDESIRRKIELAKFFTFCVSKINKEKPLMIETESTEGFERYIKHIDGNKYQFVGLRYG